VNSRQWLQIPCNKQVDWVKEDCQHQLWNCKIVGGKEHNDIDPDESLHLAHGEQKPLVVGLSSQNVFGPLYLLSKAKHP
jgi:hypothetical protein